MWLRKIGHKKSSVVHRGENVTSVYAKINTGITRGAGWMFDSNKNHIHLDFTCTRIWYEYYFKLRRVLSSWESVVYWRDYVDCVYNFRARRLCLREIKNVFRFAFWRNTRRAYTYLFLETCTPRHRKGGWSGCGWVKILIDVCSDKIYL